MSSEFLASSWKYFCGCGILCVQTVNYAVLFRGYKFRGSLLNHENHENFTPPPPKNTRYTVCRTVIGMPTCTCTCYHQSFKCCEEKDVVDVYAC